MAVRRRQRYGKEHGSATEIRQSVAAAWRPQRGRGTAMMLSDMPMYYAGGGFPWGLLIIGGIVYFLWTKGVFDGRGRFGNGGRFGGFGAGYGPAQVRGREALPASAARARCSRSGTGMRTRLGAHRLRLRRPPRRQRRQRL